MVRFVWNSPIRYWTILEERLVLHVAVMFLGQLTGNGLHFGRDDDQMRVRKLGQDIAGQGLYKAVRFDDD
jgi:hypothetical protein